MLKSCTRKMFDELPIEEQNRCKARMGTWYQSQGRYEEAIHWLSLSDNYEALLNAVEENRGYALNIQHQEEVLRVAGRVPEGNSGPPFLRPSHFHAPPLHLPANPGNAAAQGLFPPERV